MADMETFNTFIKSQPERSRQAWADFFGVSRPHLYGLMDGTRCPSPEVAQRIEALTEGNVPVTAWPNIRAVLDAVRGAA
jgi:DNA-binding transcriptional regulator YdaS (Cro superfamily)